jgi:hypothetical protein
VAARAAPASSEATFWRNVSELLGTAEQEREDRGEIETFDALADNSARSLRTELDELALLPRDVVNG